MLHCIKFAIAAGALAATPLLAADLAQPQGEIILTISGAITNFNDEGSAVFDAEMLGMLPVVEFATSTIWTDGQQTFTGVSLVDLLAHVGSEGTSISATAINDYAVEVPLSGITDGVPILAYMMNGSPMSVRDKGPLWIVYPFDSDPKYQTEVVYSQSIWQLDRIVVSE
jgi:hypothetical protein